MKYSEISKAFDKEKSRDQAMTGIGDRLHNIRDHLRTGRFGQREAWEQDLTEAAAEIERLKTERKELVALLGETATKSGQRKLEIERLQESIQLLRLHYGQAVDDIKVLRTALKPFAEAYDALMQQDEAFPRYHSIDTARLREAHAALESKPTSDDR